MLKLFKSKSGEGYVDVSVFVFCSMLCVALFVNIIPIFIQKNQLDTFANELIREGEIAGRIGTETTKREQQLREYTGITPNVVWSKNGNIQLNEEFNVTLTHEVDLGFFTFGSFPITLTSKAIGKSEVYWK